MPIRPLPLLAALAAMLVAGGAAWQWPNTREAAASADPVVVLATGPAARPVEQDHCLSLLRDDPDAARAYAAGWEARGGGEAARYCAAMALLAAGDPARAAERLEALARNGGGGPAARAALFGQAGQAWTLAGDANRAYAAATLALTLAPDDPDLLLDRAISVATQGRFAEALEDLDRAVALAPDRAEAWVLRATALRRTDRAAAASDAIATALRLEPEGPEALLERGILRLERGDRDGANADWRRVLAVAPDSAAADLAQQNLALNEAGPARR